MKEPYGYCQCGCGEITNFAPRTDKKRGWIKGQPLRFIHNHHCRGSANWNWNGGRSRSGEKYFRVWRSPGIRDREHRLIAEKVLGKPLPPGAEVHHYDGYSDESRAKLVICESKSYHRLIEARTQAFRTCGHANWRKCKYCHEYDDPKNLYINHDGRAAIHRSCNAEAQRKIREKKSSANMQIVRCRDHLEENQQGQEHAPGR